LDHYVYCYSRAISEHFRDNGPIINSSVYFFTFIPEQHFVGQQQQQEDEEEGGGRRRGRRKRGRKEEDEEEKEEEKS